PSLVQRLIGIALHTRFQYGGQGNPLRKSVRLRMRRMQVESCPVTVPPEPDVLVPAWHGLVRFAPRFDLAPDTPVCAHIGEVVDDALRRGQEQLTSAFEVATANRSCLAQID